MYLFTNDHLVDTLLDKWGFEEAFELLASEGFDEFFIGHTVFGVTKYFKVTALEETEDTADEEEDINEDNEDNNDLLSLEAINWLHSIDYGKKTHEERMALIRAAKIAYPN